MKLLALVSAMMLGAIGGAQAQQGFNYIDPNSIGLGDGSPNLAGRPVNTQTTYVDVVAPRPGAFTPTGEQIYGREFVRLSDVLAAAGGGGVTGGQLSAALAGIAARFDRLENRFSEGVALAGAVNVLPPNPGDRFAVSFGGAGYNGAGAASATISVRLREDVIAYGAIARGPTQTLVKGGIGFSFR